MPVKDAAAQRTAEVWLVDLAGSGPALAGLEHDEPRLGPLERAAILALKDAGLRQGRLLAHLALRVVLERALGAGVRGVDLERPAGAMPRLPAAAGRIAFSLAHGDRAALIGIARGAAIGVDLERVRPVAIAERRRQRILWAGAALMGSGGGDDASAELAFMRAWVRLEAIAKANGRGLARTLSALGVWHGQAGGGARGGESEVAARVRNHLAQTGLKVHDLALARGSVAAVALEQGVGVPLPRAFPVERAGIEALLGEGAALRPRPGA